ncbi:MAG: hypothetical protein JOZ99_05990 [Actinobacteria bacterium]|nr:hypothetical protein [Actinomycetota bacterium]
MHVFRHRRVDPVEDPPAQATASTSVRILRGEEELRAALERASDFERLLMSQASARAARYSRLTSPLDPSAASNSGPSGSD